MNTLCKNCGKKLGENLEGRIEIVCPRCGVFNKFISEYSSYKIVPLDKKATSSL